MRRYSIAAHQEARSPAAAPVLVFRRLRCSYGCIGRDSHERRKSVLALEHEKRLAASYAASPEF
jgi:hypothetical protein